MSHHDHHGHGHSAHSHDQTEADALEATNSAHWSKMAKEYEDPASTYMTHEIATKLQETLKDRLDTDTVLMDYACGPGLVSFEFLGTVKRIVGVDVAQGMVDVFTQRAKDKGIADGRAKAVLVSKGDLKSIVAAEGDFDIIICNHSYHHFHDLDAVTASLASALAPGGTLIVSDFLAIDETGHETPFGRSDDKESLEIAKSHGVHHRHGFSKKDMQDLFDRHLVDVQVDDTFSISKKKLKDLGGENKMARFLKNMEHDDRIRYVIASGRRSS